MRSPHLIFAIILLVALGGATLLVFEWWILGGIVTAIGLALLYVWWRVSQILRISTAITSNDMARARVELDKIRTPEKLNAYSKTYYYLFKGIVEVQTNDFKGARTSFKTSLETNRFRGVDEKATALVMMAQLDLRQRNNEGAKRWLREARDLKPSEPIREQIGSIVKQGRLRL